MSTEPRLAEARADLARGRATWRNSFVVQFIVALAVFLAAAYPTVSTSAPGSIPVQHDDVY